MSRFFLDASAIVKYYNEEPHSDKVKYLIDEKFESPARFFVPNIAILETVGTFYRAHYMDGRIPLDSAKSLAATFLNDLAEGKKFALYSLRQSHINEAVRYFESVFNVYRSFREMAPW